MYIKYIFECKIKMKSKKGEKKMKAIKKVIGAFALSALSLSLVACDFKKAENKPYENQTKVTNKIDDATDGIDKNGHFEEDKGYTINYSKTVKENKTSVTIEYLAEYSFKKGGSVHYKDVKNSIEKDYSYTIKNNVITLTKDGSEEYLYYYGNVIVTGDAMSTTGTLDGVAVSQMGTTTIGYVSTVILAKGADKSALADNTNNENKYYPVRKNGTLGTTGKRILADQLAKFDTSSSGSYVTTINISGKTYPAIVHII